ncbi:MAG: AMP-binding protein, partial [Euryarchaeota archaeon]|nr:AMP-binding protein [Euryarchaeota archaeon]
LSAGPRIVSMCAEEGSDSPPKEIIRWKDFLEMGDIGEDGFASPAGFGDLATIRYTSGTTGRPRGVTFRHDQLRYMAESLASLPPWEARNSEVRYLSFLPMNHVVEGILGTYSPYYAPAPLKLYFLEDFRDLQKALPIARPSIFFSVPRFYEKVWEGFSESGAGRSYLASKGTKRKIMRWFVRRSLLKRIGLDSCRQLIAGSAPSSEQILQGFRELGIEIHNAYGLTEAPLVTLNRLGRNRLGTVGEPLPKTEVKAGPEGDILVKGPQVTTGYFGKEESPFEDGWLVTGDVGYVTGEGSLVVTGRRKEIIKTSYGKLIHPMKAEAMLRDIPGVTEAMLVGDNRPFCIAFIWVDELHKDMSSFEAIDRAVSEANERLSNPERPKRWAVMAYDLAIEKGDLTANLKLKRREIGRRLQGIESFLYAGEEKPEAMLHVGEVKEE